MADSLTFFSVQMELKKKNHCELFDRLNLKKTLTFSKQFSKVFKNKWQSIGFLYASTPIAAFNSKQTFIFIIILIWLMEVQ